MGLTSDDKVFELDTEVRKVSVRPKAIEKSDSTIICEVKTTDNRRMYEHFLNWSKEADTMGFSFSMITVDNNPEDEDRIIGYDRVVDQYHPCNSKHPMQKSKHEIYCLAMHMVGAKNTKFGLVNIINALLVENLLLEKENALLLKQLDYASTSRAELLLEQYEKTEKG
jgi:hypothetical protein